MTLKKWLAIGAALSVLGFLMSALSNLNLADESWFLQLVNRVGLGEVLYRDVFCGVTPLSVYLTVLFTKCFGVEILVLKGVNAIIFATTILLCCYSLHRLDKQGFSWNLAIALCLFYPSGVVGGCGSSYNPLANLFFVGCFLCVILPFSTVIRYIGATVCAAFCFGSKQNIGLIALLALTILVGIYQAKKMWWWIWGIFAFISALILLPVVFSGGWESFLDYAFLNKTTYMQRGDIPYFTRAHFCALRVGLSYSLPLIAIGALTYILLKDRGPQRTLTATLLIFCVGSFLAIFPRADEAHLMIAMPMTFIGLIYTGRRIIPKFPWNAKAIPILLGLFFLRTHYNEVRDLARGKRVLLTLDHFHGACVNLDVQEMIKMQVRAIKLLDPEKYPIFFLSPFAGFYYLALDLYNPTPFDYPFITAFGRSGQGYVISQLAQGLIQSVIVDDIMSSEKQLQPTQLYDYVHNEMHCKEYAQMIPQLKLYRK